MNSTAVSNVGFPTRHRVAVQQVCDFAAMQLNWPHRLAPTASGSACELPQHDTDSPFKRKAVSDRGSASGRGNRGGALSGPVAKKQRFATKQLINWDAVPPQDKLYFLRLCAPREQAS